MLRSVFLLLLCLLLTESLHASDWPQWRGPQRNGEVAERAVPWPDRLSNDNLKQRWRIELGPSYSGPVISGERVFTTETVNEEVEVVSAFERKTGRLLWKTEWTGALKVPFFAASNGSWIRSTPVCSGNALYVAGIRDVLVSLDVASGKVHWRIDFTKEFDTPLPAFGCVCSPLVDGDDIYVQAGAGLVKLDRHTGRIQWRTLTDAGGMMGSAFSSPVFATIQGVRQLLVQTRTELTSVDPANGAVLWRVEIPAFRGMNILTPIAFGDTVFTSSYGGASLLFKPERSDDGWAVTQVWRNKLQGYMSTPIVRGNYAFMHLRNQRFACLNLESGKDEWITTPFGKYWSLVSQGDRLLTLDEAGDLRLIRTNPEQFEQIDEVHVSDSPTWAHLAVADSNICIRELNALVMYEWQDTPKPDVQ